MDGLIDWLKVLRFIQTFPPPGVSKYMLNHCIAVPTWFKLGLLFNLVQMHNLLPSPLYFNWTEKACMVTVDQGQAKQSYEYFPPLPLSFLPLFFLPALATIGWLLTWYTHSYPYRINRSNLEDLLFWAMCYILKRTVSWRIIDEAWPKHHTIFLCSAIHTTIHKAMEQPSGASLGSEWCPEYLILPEVTSSITH